LLVGAAGTLAAAGAAYGAVLGAVSHFQERLLFHPEPLPADYPLASRASPAGDVHEERIAVDGAVLDALHLRLSAPKGIVFFLHGNAGNLSTWFVNADFYRRANFDLFMPDYRGYGRSTGRIQGEAQLRDDAARAWASVAPRYEGRRRVIVGRSLGTALAAGLAASVRPDLTVLVSPYWSIAELARRAYPWIPGGLLRYPLETYRDVPRIDGPLLLIHGERDTVIPPDHSLRLARIARRPETAMIAGAGHGDLQDFGDYLEAIRRRLDAI